MRKGKNPTNHKIKSNDWNTPLEAFELIFQYVDKTKRIYFPFFNDGSLVNHLNTLEVNYIHSNTDFFTYEPEEYNCIVDNPPYSIKQKVFERCIALDKPFALLVPMDTLDRQYFSKLFKNRDFTIIIPNKRYNFVSNEKKLTPAFKCIWITLNLNLGTQIIFE
tara:strand:- start:240 stop:728 length:489 start_codon:yes stop_codon:yes gene_type:complete